MKHAGTLAAIIAAALASMIAVHSPAAQAATSEAVGFYSNGSLRHGVTLPLEAEGFLKLFTPRNRGWGTHQLRSLILGTARELTREFPFSERLQFGDLSQQLGGSISGHASHQNGLDADGVYLRVDRREQDPRRTSGFDEEFVLAGSNGTAPLLSDNFDMERNWWLMNALVTLARAQGDEVGRIFVDPKIKHAFCEYARVRGELTAEHETLRRLRPWPNHGDHFHLRLECPAGNKKCVTQEPPPPGHGCEELHDAYTTLSDLEPGSRRSDGDPVGELVGRPARR